MSMELHVLLKDDKLPTAEQWQRGLREAGFDLALDSSLSVRENSGFIPVVYEGKDTGFEFHVYPASDTTDTYPEAKAQAPDLDLSANFRWGGDFVEMSAAIVASAILTKLTDGVCFDPQEGTFANGDEAVALAKDTIQQLGL